MKTMQNANLWETTKGIVTNHMSLILSLLIVAMMIIGCSNTAIRA